MLGGRTNNWPPIAGKRVQITTANGVQIGVVKNLIGTNQALIEIQPVINKDVNISGMRGYKPVYQEFVLSPSQIWSYVDTSSGREGVGMGLTKNSDYKFHGQIYEKKFPITYTKEFLEWIDNSNGRYNLALKNMEPLRDFDVNAICINAANEAGIEDQSLLEGRQDEMLGVLQQPKPIRKKDQIVVNNLDITAHKLIVSEDDENLEGEKMRKWINDNLINFIDKEGNKLNLLKDLVVVQYLGYIYLTKKSYVDQKYGPIDKVTEELLEKHDVELKILDKDIVVDRPINIRLLVSNFINNANTPIVNQLKLESLQLVGLEYFLCLQPEPRYQLFILKKLVLLWYSDPTLIENVLKIKVIINQWRCRRDQVENKKLGILPSIVIFTKYGLDSFNRVFQKLHYYFSNFIATGWKNNDPDYYEKHNDLIFSTNGSVEVKRMIEDYPLKGEYYSLDSPNPWGRMTPGSIPSYYPQSHKEKTKKKEAQESQEESQPQSQPQATPPAQEAQPQAQAPPPTQEGQPPSQVQETGQVQGQGQGQPQGQTQDLTGGYGNPKIVMAMKGGKRYKKLIYKINYK